MPVLELGLECLHFAAIKDNICAINNVSPEMFAMYCQYFVKYWHFTGIISNIMTNICKIRILVQYFANFGSPLGDTSRKKKQ